MALRTRGQDFQVELCQSYSLSRDQSKVEQEHTKRYQNIPPYVAPLRFVTILGERASQTQSKWNFSSARRVVSLEKIQFDLGK